MSLYCQGREIEFSVNDYKSKCFLNQDDKLASILAFREEYSFSDTD
jgi:hypothetical protein